MVKIAVGTTISDKAILIRATVQTAAEVMNDFKTFSDHDLFDAITAIEYLTVREMRRTVLDREWLRSLNMTRQIIVEIMKRETMEAIKMKRGLTSAFAVRDYGRARLYQHFKD